MDFNDDIHLDVCQNIEVGLKEQYELYPELTDNLCVFGLEQAIVALKKKAGYAKNMKVSNDPLVQGIIKWCVDIGEMRIGKLNDLTLEEYVARIKKIKKSVILHSSLGGKRGYYEFIKDYV
jgi:hypothetical protein